MPPAVQSLPLYEVIVSPLQTRVALVAEANERIGHYMRDADIGAGMPTPGMIEAAMKKTSLFGLSREDTFRDGGDALIITLQSEIGEHTQFPEAVFGIVC